MAGDNSLKGKFAWSSHFCIAFIGFYSALLSSSRHQGNVQVYRSFRSPKVRRPKCMCSFDQAPENIARYYESVLSGNLRVLDPDRPATEDLTIVIGSMTGTCK